MWVVLSHGVDSNLLQQLQETHPILKKKKQNSLKGLLAASNSNSMCCAQLCPTLWDPAHQALLSMGCSRQEYWSCSPFLSPGDIPDPGIELTSPALTGGFCTTEPCGKPWKDWCWSWISNTLSTWYEEPTHWKRCWCWERLRPGLKGGGRGWGG